MSTALFTSVSTHPCGIQFCNISLSRSNQQLLNFLTSLPSKYSPSSTCSTCQDSTSSHFLPICTVSEINLKLSSVKPVCDDCYLLHQPNKVLSAFASSDLQQGKVHPLLTKWSFVANKSLDEVSLLSEGATAAYALLNLCSSLPIVDHEGNVISTNWKGDNFISFLKENTANEDSSDEEVVKDKPKKKRNRRK
ncbi:hypothetical protein P9112_011460 [Eukaryota sp. TZLM1-RC]